MSNFGTGQNIFAAAANQNKDQNPSNSGSTPAAAGGGLFGNLGTNTTSSTAFGGAGAGSASAPGSGAPGPGTSGGFSGAGGGIFGGGGSANANAPNPTGAGANASPFGFAKPTNAGGGLFGPGLTGPSSTNASGPTGGIIGGGGGGGGGGGPSLFSGLGSQPKTSDTPAPTASPFGSLPGGSLFPKASGTGTPATTATTNTQPQPAFSLGGATSTGDKTAPAAAPASQCLILLVTALPNHKGPQQVGSLRALVPLQTKMESLRKRKTALLVRLQGIFFIFSLTLSLSASLARILPWWAAHEHNTSLYSTRSREKGRCSSPM